MKLTRYGRREWLGSLILAVLAIFAVCGLAVVFPAMRWSPAIIVSALIFLVWICIAAFFRDPDRKVPVNLSVVLSPADGTVNDIELIKGETAGSEKLRELFQGRDMLRIGIFLSVFNVHLNRAPVKMKVAFREYKEGAFHDARDDRASRENESMLVGAEGVCCDDIRFPLAVRQISGAIARRIVCPVKEGDVFGQGERYGMIKFGSRTELYLPAGMKFELAVTVGQTVTAGITPLAHIYPAAVEKIRQTQIVDAAAASEKEEEMPPV